MPLNAPRARRSNGAGSSRPVIDMLKTLLLVLAGLCAGLAIAFWLQPGPIATLSAAEEASAPPSVESPESANGGGSDARLAALEQALAFEAEQRAALEARVAELTSAIDALREQRPGDPANDRLARAETERERTPIRREAELTPEERERAEIERLQNAGFAPDRAAWIQRRREELRMEALQAQYEARRAGRPSPSDFGERALRTDLGDADYERYLQSMGRLTTVPIAGVLESSPAQRSGLKAGDEIVAYNGQRVFDITELNEMVLGGVPGESVVVDVRRGGQNLQLVIPRGPLGIWGPSGSTRTTLPTEER